MYPFLPLLEIKRIRYIILINCLILIGSLSFGQQKVNFIEGSLGIVQKSGGFRSLHMNERFSVDISYLRQLQKNEPLFWGINSYYFTLGNTTGTFEEPFDLGFEEFFYSTTSNVWGNHFLLRFYPDIYLGKLELYIEAHLGFRYLFTVTSRSIEEGSDVSEYLSESHSLSVTYGATGGLQYPLNESYFLNASIGYFPGISASYYTKNRELTISTATIEGFEFRNSPTDIFRYSLGITYRF